MCSYSIFFHSQNTFYTFFIYNYEYKNFKKKYICN